MRPHLARALAVASIGILPILPGTVTMTASAEVASSTETASVVVLPYGADDWRYQERKHDGSNNNPFVQPGFDDSNWELGRAGFGTTAGPCSFESPDQVHTDWSGPNDELDLRRHFQIPANATGVVRIDSTVASDSFVFINGQLVSHLFDESYCPADSDYTNVPLSKFNVGGDNVISIVSQDSDNARFVDVSITATVTSSRPIVTGVSPNTGPNQGGNTVTITGQHFTGTTAVTFGHNQAPDFTVVSDTEINAVAPEHPGRGRVVQVRVRTAGSLPSPIGHNSRFVYPAH